MNIVPYELIRKCWLLSKQSKVNSLKRVDTIHLLVIALFIFLVVGLSFGMIGPETSTCRHNESIEMIVTLAIPYGPQYVIITLPEGFLNDSHSKGLLWWFTDKKPPFIKLDGTIDIKKWVIERDRKDFEKKKREKGIREWEK